MFFIYPKNYTKNYDLQYNPNIFLEKAATNVDFPYGS